MKSKIMMAACMLIQMILLSGCWDQKELPDLAIVTAFGIDIDEDGKYVGTFQIVVPSNIAGVLEMGGGEGSPITIYQATGKSMVELSRNVASKISRSLYYSHTNLVVISEELAKKKGINRILEALDRDIQFRNTAKVVIANEAKAADILEVTVPIDKIPANKVIETIANSEESSGRQISVSIGEVIDSFTTEGKEAIMPGVKIKGNVEKGKNIENINRTAPEATIQLDGMAIFKGDRLIHKFKHKESEGTVWILDKIDETNVSIDWGDEKDAISFEVINEKTKTSIHMKDGKPNVKIFIRASGEIGEVAVPIDLKNHDNRKKIEKKVETEIKEIVLHAVEHAKTHKTDVFGFGEQIYRSYPKQWKKLEKNWNDQHFPELNLDVTVEASIVRMGLRENPFMKKDHD